MDLISRSDINSTTVIIRTVRGEYYISKLNSILSFLSIDTDSTAITCIICTCSIAGKLSICNAEHTIIPN